MALVTLRALILALLLALAWGCSSSEHSPSPPEASRAPETPPATAADQQPKDDRPLIVAFGDSLSAGFGADPGQSYPDYLQKLVDSSAKRYHVYNEGVSGDTTTDGLQRLPGILALRPKIVILELGGNDGLRGLPPETTKANLAQIIAPLRKAGIQVVIAGMTLPRNYGPVYIHQFEQVYVQLANQFNLVRIPFLLQGVGGVPRLMQP